MWVLRATALVGLILGCSGVLAEVLFSQQSLLKWAVTVTGPLVVLGLSLSRRPVSYLAAVLVALLPFLRVAVSFKGASFPLAAPVFLSCVIAAFLVTRGTGNARVVRTGSRLKAAALIALVLLLPSVLRGKAADMWLLQVAVVIGLAYVLSRAWDLDADAGYLVFPAVAGTLALQGLLAIHEYQTGRPLSYYGGESGYGASYSFSYGDVFRPAGSFNDPISLGNFFAIGIPLLLALIAQRGPHGLLRRGWYAICALAAAAGLVLTFSRMSWVGAVVGVLAVLILSPAAERARQIVLLSGGALVMSSTVVALAGAELSSRFSSIFDPTATGVRTAQSDEARRQLWATAFDVFTGHPIFGVGHGYLHSLLIERVGGETDTHAHSTYLQTLAEAGVFGGLALLVVLGVFAIEVSRRVRDPLQGDVMARACAGAVAAVLVVWTTDYTVRFAGVLGWMSLPFIFLYATRAAKVTSETNEFTVEDKVGTVAMQWRSEHEQSRAAG